MTFLTNILKISSKYILVAIFLGLTWFQTVMGH